MPDAGAGKTSGADFASGSGGKYVCWPIFLDWRGGFGVAARVAVLLTGLPAIAEVDRNASGRRSSLAADRLFEAGGGPSGLFALLAVPAFSLFWMGSFGTGLVTVGDLGRECDCDCERERESLVTLDFRLSVLLLDE
jgi:hypothetical protein